MLTQSQVLSPAQVRQFHDLGFTTIEGYLTPAEIDAGRTALSRVIREKLVDLDIEPAVKNHPEVVAEPELAVRKLMFFTGVDPVLKAMSEHPTLVAAVEQLLGEHCVMTQDMALLKPPFIGREKPWHQDNAYFRWGPPEKIVGTWTALDDATPENGCMQVIPGTHRQGPVPHFHLRDCQIPDDRVSAQNKVPVPLKAGGVMIFSGLLHHGTENNTSSARRRALQFHFRGKTCHPLSPQQHGDMFNENHRYAGCGIYPKQEAEHLTFA